MRKLLILSVLLTLALPLYAAENQKDLTFFGPHRVFPHIAIGGPWSSTAILMNLATTDTETTMLFFKPDGTPWTVTDDNGASFSALTITLGALGMIIIELPSTGPDVETGWAQIDQPEGGSIGGQLIFRDNGGPGRPIPFEAVVPLTDFVEGSDNLSDTLWIMHVPFDQRAGFNTCYAIANPNNFQMEVAVVAVDLEEGVVDDATAELTFAPGNQRAFCLNTELPSLAGRRGFLTIARNPNTFLGMLGLRFDQAGAFTTFFPMAAP